MPTIRELVTKWKYDVDTSDLKRAERQLERTGRASKQGLDPKRPRAMAGGLAALGASAGMMAGTVAVAAGAAATGIGLLGRKAVLTAGRFQDLETSFSVMLGSADKADKLMRNIFDFAEKTPFEIPQLVQGIQRLLAYNIAAEDLLPTMEMLGNISAGVGREKMPQLITAFGQVRAATKLTGMELRQFTETGVPLIQALAEHFGVAESAIQEMTSRGEIKFEDVRAALQSMTEEGGAFQNLMDELSKNIITKFSNVADKMTVIFKKIGDRIIPPIEEMTEKLLAFLDENEDAIARFTSSGMIILIEAVESLAESIKFLYRLSPLSSLVRAADAMLRIKNELSKVGDEGESAFGSIGEGVRKTGKILNWFIDVLIFIKDLPGLILEDIATFLEGGDSVVGRVQKAFDTMLQTIQEKIQSIFDTLKMYWDDLFSNPFGFLENIGRAILDTRGILAGKTVDTPPTTSESGPGFLSKAASAVGQFFGGESEAVPAYLQPQMIRSAPVGPSSVDNRQSRVEITNHNTINANGLNQEAARDLILANIEKKQREMLDQVNADGFRRNAK